MEQDIVMKIVTILLIIIGAITVSSLPFEERDSRLEENDNIATRVLGAQTSFPCFRTKCVLGTEFCHLKARLCLPCSKFANDCFTVNHKHNCTAFCKSTTDTAGLTIRYQQGEGHTTELPVLDQNSEVKFTGALDDDWIWLLIAVVVLIIAVTVVLRLLPVIRRELLNLSQKGFCWCSKICICSVRVQKEFSGVVIHTNKPDNQQGSVTQYGNGRQDNVPLLEPRANDSRTGEPTPSSSSSSIPESGNNCNPQISDVTTNGVQEQDNPDVKVMYPSHLDPFSFDACPS